MTYILFENIKDVKAKDLSFEIPGNPDIIKECLIKNIKKPNDSLCLDNQKIVLKKERILQNRL